LVIAVTAVLNFHFQLAPLQILFINLVTDVLPALALGVTAGSANIMKQKPRPANEALIDRSRWQSILAYALVIGTSSIAAVVFSHILFHNNEGWNPLLCNNILFLTLIFSQLMHVFNMGTGNVMLHRSEVIRNRYAWYAVMACAGLVIGMYEIPVMRHALDLYRLSSFDWLVVVGFSFAGFLVNQVAKRLKWVRH
jgi:P-type Ca2+ transporter type 2C